MLKTRIENHLILGLLPPAETFDISLDGNSLAARSGESIAAALLANNRPVCRYSPVRSEPRGLFCGTGRCGDCFMEVDGVPGVAACITPVRRGLTVRTANGLPVPGPLYRPGDSGRVTTGDATRNYVPREVDALIIGAGFSGIGLALAADRAGLQVCLVDENPAPAYSRSLSLRLCPALPEALSPFFPELTRPGLRDFEAAALLDERLKASRVKVINGTAVSGLILAPLAPTNLQTGSKPIQAILSSPAFTGMIRAGRITLATGSYSLPPAFPGWTLPGVLTERAALDLLHRYRVRPGERALVVGGGNRVAELAAWLELGGVDVAGTVRAGAKTPLETNHNPLNGYYLSKIAGQKRVAQVTLQNIDPHKPVIELAVDTVCLVGQTAPVVELAVEIGARFFIPDGATYPALELDQSGQTSLPSIFVVGSAANYSAERNGWQSLWDGWRLAQGW